MISYRFFSRVAIITSLLLTSFQCSAEVVLDGSLGKAEILKGPDFQIEADDGQLRGTNLFHSFSQFDLTAKQSATFNGPAQISNIIGRITNGQMSSINGSVRSNIAGANLYLLNPKGFILGPQAVFEVDGALRLSSADYLAFSDGQRFLSQVGTENVLSVASPTAFGFLSSQPGNITINGSGLYTSENHDITLIGGALTFSNGFDIFAPQGKLQLASVAAPGEIEGSDMDHHSISQWGTVTVREGSLDVSGEQGGSVWIRAGHFLMQNAAIKSESNGEGRFRIVATDKIALSDGGFIQMLTTDNTGGDIHLKARQIELKDGGFIGASTLGQGQSGNITLQATDLLRITGKDSYIINGSSANGAGGQIRLHAQAIYINEGGEVTAASTSSGQNGLIQIQGNDIQIQGGRINLLSKQSLAGSVSVQGQQLWLTEGGLLNSEGKSAQINIDVQEMGIDSSSLVMSQGDNGVVSINVGQALHLYGGIETHSQTDQANLLNLSVGQLYLQGGRILSQSDKERRGQAAPIVINANTLHVNGGNINTSKSIDLNSRDDITIERGAITTTVNQGTAGTINIHTGQLRLSNTGMISSVAEGSALAGAIAVQADQAIIVDGGKLSSEASLPVNSNYRPMAINLESPLISLTNSGLVIANNSGNIESNAQQVTVTQNSRLQVNNDLAAEIVIQAKSVLLAENGHIRYTARGLGGGIRITTEEMSIDDKSTLAASGQAQTIQLTANTLHLHTGGRLISEGVDNTVVLNVKQNTLLNQGATLYTQGGSLSLETPELQVDEGIILSEGTSDSNDNRLIINTNRLILRNGGYLANNTQSNKTGGVTEVHATESVTIQGYNAVGKASGIFSQVKDAPIAGRLFINTPRAHLSQGGIITADTIGAGQGGILQLQVDELLLDSGAQVGSNTFGTGQGGEVQIDAKQAVTIKGNDTFTGLRAQSVSQGRGGRISLTTPIVAIEGNAGIVAETSGAGRAGDITLAVNRLDLQQGARLSVSSGGSGDGGLLTIQANEMLKINGINNQRPTGLFSDTQLQGNGGNINLTTPILSMEGGVVQAITFGKGNAGKIDLQLAQLDLRQGAQINASSQGTGAGGDITIQVRDRVDIAGQSPFPINDKIQPSSISNGSLGNGRGGTIRLTTPILNLDQRGTIQTLTRGDGSAGDIVIDVHDLRVSNGSDIDASNEGTGQGQGGAIHIHATGLIWLSAEQLLEAHTGNLHYFGGIYSNAKNAGAGGNVILTADRLLIEEGGTISAGSTGEGHAGHLNIQLNDWLKMQDGSITTHASQAGGGNIRVAAEGRIHLRHSQITARTEGKKPQDSGGNVVLQSGEFILLDKSQVLASAIAGHGGNIEVTAANFVPSGDTILDASSQLGVNGRIQVNAPDTDIASSLVVLPNYFLDAAALLKTKCGKPSRTRSRFIMINLQQLPDSPEDLKPSAIPVQ